MEDIVAEIVIRIDPKQGKIKSAQVLAENEEDQVMGLKHLQLFLRDINRFRIALIKTSRLAQIFWREDAD